MTDATLDNQDLKMYLINIIKSGDKVALDNISDQIFSLIKHLDKEENKYDLSIALTNYYFETFWIISIVYIQSGNTKKAEENMLLSCQNVWKQEVYKKLYVSQRYFLLLSWVFPSN